MPVYEVTDPDTGKTLEIEGDSPPSEQELEQIFSSQPEPDFIGAGVIEPAMAVASGIEKSITGGLSGIAQSLNPLAEKGAGAEAVMESRDSAYQPKTQAGKEGLETLSDLMQKGVDLINIPLSGLGGIAELVTGQGIDKAAETVKAIQQSGVAKRMGERTFEETDSPLAAATAETIPAAIGSVIGLKGADKTFKSLKGAANATKEATKDVAKNIFTYQSPTKQKIIKLIEEGSPHIDTAKYRLVNNKAVKDGVAVNAINQGFDEGVIAAVKAASSTDKVKMQRMVNIMQKGKKNSRYAVTNRPSDVAGESLIERVRYIQSANKKAGEAIDKASKGLKNQSVDIAEPVARFSEALNGFGIQIKKNSKGEFVPDFRLSELAPGDRGPIREVIRQMSIKSQSGDVDAFTVHKMKRIIDRNVTYGKTAKGLSGDAERALKQFRGSLDGALDGKFTDYDAANTLYADTIGALDSIQSAAGRKLDFSSPSAAKGSGTLIRRVMSNAQSRAGLIDAIDELEVVAKNAGARFDDDLLNQALFVDELDRVFGPVARTSLQGQVDQAVQRGVNAVSSKSGAVEAMTDVAKEAANKARGVNEQNAFKSIIDVLRDKNKNL